MQRGAALTDYVATRWYRAPELLLGWEQNGQVTACCPAHCGLTESIYRATLRMDILWIFGPLGALWVSSWMDNPFSQVVVLCVCSVATSLQHSLQCRSFVAAS